MYRFADRLNAMHFPPKGTIRIPNTISLSGGQPDPQYFPTEEFAKAFTQVLAEKPEEACLYGSPFGSLSFRTKISERLDRKFGIKSTPDQVIPVSGSQQGLDLIGRIFLNEGDYVACENPTYFGCFRALSAENPRFVSVPTDKDGMIPEELDRILSENERIKVVYVIPNFQNPTGNTWSLERRKAFMEVVQKYDVVVLEDDAYGELRYDGDHLPALKSMDPKEQVIYSGSFSKILCPGFRLAFLLASDEIIKEIANVKGMSDMHVPAIMALMVDRFADNVDLDAHVERLIPVYRRKRDIMIAAMREYLPDTCEFIVPQGGLFIWVTYPECYDPDKFFEAAIERKVVFVKGDSFFVNPGNRHHFRLNFSFVDEDMIPEAIKRIGEAISLSKIED